MFSPYNPLARGRSSKNTLKNVNNSYQRSIVIGTVTDNGQVFQSKLIVK